jgi:hypothetical protein
MFLKLFQNYKFLLTQSFTGESVWGGEQSEWETITDIVKKLENELDGDDLEALQELQAKLSEATDDIKRNTHDAIKNEIENTLKWWFRIENHEDLKSFKVAMKIAAPAFRFGLLDLWEIQKFTDSESFTLSLVDGELRVFTPMENDEHNLWEQVVAKIDSSWELKKYLRPFVNAKWNDNDFDSASLIAELDWMEEKEKNEKIDQITDTLNRWVNIASRSDFDNFSNVIQVIDPKFVDISNRYEDIKRALLNEKGEKEFSVSYQFWEVRVFEPRERITLNLNEHTYTIDSQWMMRRENSWDRDRPTNNTWGGDLEVSQAEDIVSEKVKISAGGEQEVIVGEWVFINEPVKFKNMPEVSQEKSEKITERQANNVRYYFKANLTAENKQIVWEALEINPDIELSVIENVVKVYEATKNYQQANLDNWFTQEEVDGYPGKQVFEHIMTHQKLDNFVESEPQSAAFWDIDLDLAIPSEVDDNIQTPLRREEETVVDQQWTPSDIYTPHSSIADMARSEKSLSETYFDALNDDNKKLVELYVWKLDGSRESKKRIFNFQEKIKYSVDPVEINEMRLNLEGKLDRESIQAFGILDGSVVEIIIAIEAAIWEYIAGQENIETHLHNAYKQDEQEVIIKENNVAQEQAPSTRWIVAEDKKLDDVEQIDDQTQIFIWYSKHITEDNYKMVAQELEIDMWQEITKLLFSQSVKDFQKEYSDLQNDGDFWPRTLWKVIDMYIAKNKQEHNYAIKEFENTVVTERNSEWAKEKPSELWEDYVEWEFTDRKKLIEIATASYEWPVFNENWKQVIFRLSEESDNQQKLSWENVKEYLAFHKSGTPDNARNPDESDINTGFSKHEFALLITRNGNMVQFHDRNRWSWALWELSSRHYGRAFNRRTFAVELTARNNVSDWRYNVWVDWKSYTNTEEITQDQLVASAKIAQSLNLKIIDSLDANINEEWNVVWEYTGNDWKPKWWHSDHFNDTIMAYFWAQDRQARQNMIAEDFWKSSRDVSWMADGWLFKQENESIIVASR